MLSTGEISERGPRKMAMEKTSTTDDEVRFWLCFANFYWVLCRHPSLSIGVDHMPLWESRSNFKATTYSLPLPKLNGHLRSACKKTCWLVRTDLESGHDERWGGKWTCEEDCKRGR
jgi:hypothetical protein